MRNATLCFLIKEKGGEWPDDIHWLPKVLERNFVKAAFTFGKNDKILKKKIALRRAPKR